MIPPHSAANAASSEALFDTDFLRRMGALARAARRSRQRARPLGGGLATGTTREVRDRRDYEPGDDPRSIDWPLFGRAERFTVRLYEEVREVDLAVLIDTSRSMGAPYPAKRAAALRLGGALAAIGLLLGHRVRVFGLEERLARIWGPARGAARAPDLLACLARTPSAGRTDFAQSLAAFEPPRGGRGLACVISDLFGRGVEDGLQRAAAWGGRAHVVQVLHPRERVPPALGPCVLASVESGVTIPVHLDAAAQSRYVHALEAYEDGLAHACARRGLAFHRAGSEQPIEPLVADILRQSGAFGRSR